jgi:hypothetical protein
MSKTLPFYGNKALFFFLKTWKKVGVFSISFEKTLLLKE